MLVGSYPFEDPEDSRNFRKTISQILSVQYSIPDYIRVSQECRQLLSRIFVADPSKRITILEIKKHPWFRNKLPKKIIEVENTNFIVREQDQPSQSVEEIMRIILEAKKLAEGSEAGDLYGSELESDDAEADADTEEVDNSGDFLAPFDTL